jgi:hypothetical protein
VTTEWDAGLAYQTMAIHTAAISLCANYTPPTPDQACALFGAGYPSTRGGYPADCDQDAFLALLEGGSLTTGAVDKQCNRCGPTGYYARISEFAAPLVGLIDETCRRVRRHAWPHVARNPAWPCPPTHSDSGFHRSSGLGESQFSQSTSGFWVEYTDLTIPINANQGKPIQARCESSCVRNQPCPQPWAKPKAHAFPCTASDLC